LNGKSNCKPLNKLDKKMIAKIAVANLRHRSLTSLLSWILLAAGIGIISLLLMLQQQLENKLTRSIEGVDMVLGAKGSPLQLILSAVYHIDNPTGNIDFAEAEKWMRHPFVEKAIPLAYGDSYKGHPIVGCTADYPALYGATPAQGRLFEKEFEALAGAAAAAKLNLQIGRQFYGAHGADEAAEEHPEHAYTLVGILAPTGTALDNLILCDPESVWALHNAEHAAGAPDENQDKTHGHEHSAENGAAPNEVVPGAQSPREITAVLLKFRNPMAQLQFPRLINEQTKLQAAVPAIEINRMFSLLGLGFEGLRYLGWGILILSGLSVFIALYNTLKERRYELALLRTLGAGRWKLCLLVLLESGMLCLAGFAGGWAFGRAAMAWVGRAAERSYKISADQVAWFTAQDARLLLAALGIGLAAALIPAWKAYSMDISKTLADL
jgi:putative ABC transport system permease protein